VNLSHNHLTAIDLGTFAGPTNLRELDVSWNRLTTLTIHSTREVFFTLVRLSLSGNPLYCDCQLSWLTTYSSLVDHKTTICCPEHDVRPAVCRHVVCGSEVTCSSTNSTLSVDRRSLCSQIVSSSLIAAVFQQQLTTASPVTQTVEMTSRVDDISSEVLPSLTSSVDNIDMTSTPCRAASSFDNAHRYIVVIAVVVGFGCGKVENLGGRMRRMKKRGPNVLYDLNDLLFFLTIPLYRVGNSTSNWGRTSRTARLTLPP